MRVLDRETQFMLIALGVVFFLFSLVYAPGALAGWISCGQWLTPPDALAPLKVITPAHLGTPAVSASAPLAAPPHRPWPWFWPW